MFFSDFAEVFIVSGFLFIQLLVRKLKVNKLNQILLLIGSLCILTTVISLATVLVHAFISLVIYFISKQIISSKNVLSKYVAYASIFGVISLFCIRSFPGVFGISSFQLASTLESLIERVGMSYIMFRHIQFIVDSLHGRIKSFSLLHYINFILFFPNFLAGPIDKYNNFKHWSDKENGTLKKALLLPGIGRITVGFVKKFLLVPLIYAYAVNYQVLMEDMSFLPALLLSLFYYSIYIYLDFSGYSDIAIGSGYITGIRTPENFRMPYLAMNISDFWKRWHMTFSDFLKNLVFKPIVTFLSGLNVKLPRLFVSVVGYLLTFIICGFWHGPTVNFGIWGLWHGVGLGIYKIWSVSGWSENLKSFLVNRNLTQVGNIGAGIITFCFVSVGWVFFNYGSNELLAIFKLLF